MLTGELTCCREFRFEERVYQFQDRRRFVCTVDVHAQTRSVADTVSEISRELFHFADRIRGRDSPPASRNIAHDVVTLAFRRDDIRPVQCKSEIWRNIHGFEEAARPIITASQPVCCTIRTASSGVMMSPLPITGIFTAAFTSAMRVQSAWPLYPCSRVRGCRATACSPQSSASRAICTATNSLSLHPARNFMVEGMEMAARTFLRICSTSGRSRSSPDPPLHFTTLFTGQPKLMSTMSKPWSSQTLAASAITSGSEPNNCAEMGCSSGSKYRYRNARVGFFGLMQIHDPCELVNSVIIRPQPP